MKYKAILLFFGWISFLNTSPEVLERAPRIDAPSVTSPISVVVPSLDLGAVLQVLANINCKIGNVNQDVCADTVLSVLGDACGILGISISEALALLIECCETDSLDFSAVFTVLQDIKDTLTDCCSTMTTDFQFTWTILADLNDTITDCCSTMTTDFQFTWTILADLNDTITTDFQFTWTILADIKDTLTSCCADLEANFCNPIFIRQSDFNPAGTTPYVISSPGVYKFAEDITYNAVAPGTTAITINSSDVVLDLQCFMLRLGNGFNTTNAIVVNPSVTDFKIQNGQVENFTNNGITISTGCARFEVTDIICRNIQLQAIFLNGPASPTTPTIVQGALKNIQVLESSVLLNSSGQSTVFIQGCADLQVLNCQFNRNNNAPGVVTTFNVVTVSNDLRCNFENIDVNNNHAAQPLNGIFILNSSFCTFTDVDIINNTTSGVTALSSFFGIVLTTSLNNEFYNCRVLGHQFPGNMGGMVVNVGCDDQLFSQCEVSNNTTTGIGIIRAFNLIVDQRVIVKDCIARNNTAPNSTIALPNFGALGYDLSSINNCLLQNNIAEDQDTGAASNSAGFRINTGTNNVVQGCQSYRQDVGYQLEPLNSTNNVFTKNIAAKNTTNYSQFPVGSNQNAADISAINGSLTIPWTNIGVN